MNCQLVVFTDLDATLLDHNNYSFEAAKPALNALASNNIPLVLNSSKTYPEMKQIRERLNNQHPFIIENGAAIIIPPHYFNNHQEECLNFSTDHQIILQTLNTLKQQDFQFRNFNSLDAKAISSLTNLSESDAQMAKERFASEPLLWDDSEIKLQEFSKAINKQQLKLIKGGRFYHVIGLFDKGSAMERTIELFEKKYPDTKLISIGLGDSPNDLPMLEAVDIAVVIKSGRSQDMQLHNTNTIFSSKEGPEGWNEEMLRIIKRHGL